MKVAHVISTFPPYRGGMGNSVYHAALEIGRRGHASVVFTPAYKGVAAGEEILGSNTSVVRLRPWLAIGNAAILPQLFWRLRNFDIIHVHYPFYGSAGIAALASLFFKGRLVLHYHMDTVGKGIKGLIFWLNSFFVLPLIARSASMITCASYDYIKRSQLAHYYLSHEKAFMEVPFGVDTKFFSPRAIEREPIILFVGGLNTQHYFKGVEQLIEAFSRLAPRYPKARLVLVGSGNLETYYKKRAAEKGITQSFSIESSASNEDLCEWYRRASVSVLPSVNKSEAFGLVLLEAMSCATPVVASNLPGVRNVFRNNEHGFLVKPGDVDALTEQLSHMLEKPEKARRMGEAARAWVEERYSWEKVGQRLEASYFRILYALPKHAKTRA